MSAHTSFGPGTRTSRHSVRAVVALVLGALLGALAAAPASAHSGLISSDPEDGATLTTAPDSLLLTFNEDILEMGTNIQITGPEGTEVSDGDPELDGPEVRQPLVTDLPAGEYVVVWRVVSADGHPIDGELTFTASQGLGASAAEGEAGGESEPAEDDTTEPVTEDPTEEVTEAADEDAASDSTDGSGGSSGAAASTDADEATSGDAEGAEEGPSAGRIALFALIALGVIGAVTAAVVRLRRNS
ncbi:copper resistance CopC family protein [Ruania alba]|uniref:CopC domain-containing protein n=1 Tax=Ruania alba TaxID=648782 RepID=A0A1H5MN06_9MICO|nr:copper resistance CopC family protein [Ruania alba]SEE90684.1 hypothetical protein SAMN04488554_3508 [Ruania alba]